MEKEKNAICILGEIDEDTYAHVAECVFENYEEYNKEGVVIIINSQGGSGEHGFAIYDLLSCCNFDITTVAIGMCSSAATILFSLGKKRYITENTVFCIHISKWHHAYSCFTSKKKKEIIAERINKCNMKMLNCYMKMDGFKITKKELDEIFDSKLDYYYDAKEVLKLGFATDKLTSLDCIVN